jgi:DNA-binding NarL/FixJ family response regulator/class 3 adenylate cyclase
VSIAASSTRSLPSGVVTFLCADIEGSTRLVQRLGDGWGPVLAETRRLLRDAVAAAGGLEIDATGDELFSAFEQPGPAIEAARTGQAAVHGHPWPGGIDVRVRMGIHTGVPMLGEDGYVGLDVHRAHRICSAGHGGQILLSEQTVSLVGDAPVLELGVHRLRDLPEPERLFQLLHDELPRDFPELRFATGVEDQMRVVLADDSVLLREGVARLLEEASFDVVAQSGTREDLLRHVAMHKPNVAIVDIRMPPTHTDEGVRAAKEIRERFPEVGVLVLSQYVEPTYALELLSESAEGVGYLLKDRVSDIDEFAAAVRRVGEGGSALDPAVVSQLVGRRRRDDPLEALTPREREVLELMAEGRSNQAISERLFITPRAVEKHVTSIFHKLRLPATSEDHRRVLAVLTFLRA